MQRRVEQGLFVGKAPYGYKNIRINGRGKVQVDNEQSKTVRRIFELYAHKCQSIDSVVRRLRQERYIYTQSHPTFVRSKIHQIFLDRSYIGEVSLLGVR